MGIGDESLWIDVKGYGIFTAFFSVVLFEDAWTEDRRCCMPSHRVPEYVNDGTHTKHLILCLRMTWREQLGSRAGSSCEWGSARLWLEPLLFNHSRKERRLSRVVFVFCCK